MKTKLATLLAVLAVAALVRAVEITLPAEKARLADSSLPGAALTTAHCFTCHSAEYTLYQPPTSSRTYWKNTVVKMQKTFGAPIPDDAIDPITDYLAKTYGAERATAPSSAPPPAKAPPGK